MQKQEKLLAEAGTRTRDSWVQTKRTNIYAKKWYIQNELCDLMKTRRERLKSALYLRLKKRKRLFLKKT